MLHNTPFSITADHAGVDTTGYRAYIDAVLFQEQPVSALSGGAITFNHATGLPRGSYVVKVSAYNPDGETFSEPITLVLTGVAPAAPLNIRFAVL